MICQRCGGEHRGWEEAVCRLNRASKLVVHGPEKVVHTDGLAVHGDAVVVHKSKHGVYADIEKRKAYRRAWMAAKRK